MKHILLWLALFPTILYAQLTPMFQTTFYFEDAVGNKDSIIVGYDTLANYKYNPNFGEVDLTTPFDSVFEVRATHLREYNGDYITSKKIVGGASEYINLPNCYAVERLVFYVNAKYQPFTISWNQKVFDNTCIKNSFFYTDKFGELIDPFAWLELPGLRYACASKTDHYQLSLGWRYEAKYEYPYILKRPVEGGGIDSLYGVGFSCQAGNLFSPCRLVSETTPPSLRPAASVLSPNPVSHSLTVANLHTSALATLAVFDQWGRLVLETTPTSAQKEIVLDTGALPNGLYFLRQRWRDGLERTDRFVKAGDW